LQSKKEYDALEPIERVDDLLVLRARHDDRRKIHRPGVFGANVGTSNSLKIEQASMVRGRGRSFGREGWHTHRTPCP
jgi:hypothetical protein